MDYNRQIFVFGSNKAGRHGRGSAKEALDNHGAIYGLGEGLQGDSYGIPTKGYSLEVLSLKEIEWYVQNFIDFAKRHPDWQFNVVKIGCGLAGYKEEQIVPMFVNSPNNCILPDGWRKNIL